MLFNRMFDDMFTDLFDFPQMRPAMHAGTPRVMSCDVREFDDHYELDVELAGYRKEDIKAEMKDGYLTIRAEHHDNDEQKDNAGRVLRSERFVGTCQRTFYVGEQVKREDVSAAFEDGVLKLAIPKKVEQPKLEENNTILIN